MTSIGHSRAARLAPALAALLALAWAPAAHAQQEADTVMLKDGKSEGKIESEDFAGISIELKGGAKRTFPWADVVGVTYGSSPELATALESYSAQRLDEALTQLEEIQGNKPRPPVLQQVLLHKAMIYEREGKSAEALATWNELLSTFPKGRYLRRASEGLVNGLLGLERAAEAVPELDKIAAGAEGVPGFAAEIEVLRGRVHEDQGDAAAAEKSYKAAEAAADASPSTKQEARVGLARCLAQGGKKAEAEQLFRGLTREEAPPHVLAGAWNGLAAKWAEEGREKKDIERLYEALYGYLRGVVQYAPRAGEPTVEYERALAGAARCFRFISQLERSPEKKRRYDQLADEHLAQLRTEFPGSPFLAEATTSSEPKPR
jgi:tetratricopeptide (TPR) repeat protein